MRIHPRIAIAAALGLLGCGVVAHPAQATLVTGVFTATPIAFSGDAPLVPLLPLDGVFTYDTAAAQSNGNGDYTFQNGTSSLTGTVDSVTMRFVDPPIRVRGGFPPEHSGTSIFDVGPGGQPDPANPNGSFFIELVGIDGPFASDALPTETFDPTAFSDPHVHFLNVLFLMDSLTITASEPVPEPASLALLASALVIWGFVRRKA